MSQTMSQTERRVFSAAFKRDIVRSIVEQGAKISCVARAYGINENVLRRWKRQFERFGSAAFPGKGRRGQHEREVYRLKEENRRYMWKCEILTKASSLLHESARRRYAFVHEHRDLYPVRILCESLNISRSGYYAYAKILAEKGASNGDDESLSHLCTHDDADHKPGVFRP